MIESIVHYRLNSLEDNFVNYLLIINVFVLFLAFALLKIFFKLSIAKKEKNQSIMALILMSLVVGSMFGSLIVFSKVSNEIKTYLREIYGRRHGIYLDSDDRVYLYNLNSKEYFKNSHGEVLLVMNKSEEVEKGNMTCKQSLKACNDYLVEHKDEILNKFIEQAAVR